MNQQSPAQSSPQYQGNVSPMARSSTWHGKDGRYGRQNSDPYNPRQSPRENDRYGNQYGPSMSPRNSDMMPLPQGQYQDGNMQNMDPLSLQIRRERILQQQKASLDAHRQRNFQPPNPYGNTAPWQQQQRPYRRY